MIIGTCEYFADLSGATDCVPTSLWDIDITEQEYTILYQQQYANFNEIQGLVENGPTTFWYSQ